MAKYPRISIYYGWLHMPFLQGVGPALVPGKNYLALTRKSMLFILVLGLPAIITYETNNLEPP
jgi:hypothetical protein